MLYPERMDRIPLMLWYLNRLDNDRTDEKKLYLFNGYPVTRKRDIYSSEAIDKLINERGVHISHSYFDGLLDVSYAELKDQFLSINQGVYEINETFDTYLKYISRKIREGQLWNPTISHWGEYLNALQNVHVEYLNDSCIEITNNNRLLISGVSIAILAVPLKSVSLEGTSLKGHNI
jgi:hypothetical protein